MAEVTGGTKKTVHLARDLAIALAVIIAVAAFFVGWYAGNHHTKKSTQNTTVTSSMMLYQNQKYGFQLMYPADWGKPTFTTSDTNGGKSYSVQFFKIDKTGKLQYYILLSMVGGSSKAVTSTSIKQLIKDNSSSFAASDDSSFATVANSTQQKVSSLSVDQIVDLNKISVSAAALTYQITGGSVNCPQNRFAQNSSGGCIEQSDYDTANQVLKSIKSI